MTSLAERERTLGSFIHSHPEHTSDHKTLWKNGYCFCFILFVFFNECHNGQTILASTWENMGEGRRDASMCLHTCLHQDTSGSEPQFILSSKFQEHANISIRLSHSSRLAYEDLENWSFVCVHFTYLITAGNRLIQFFWSFQYFK